MKKDIPKRKMKSLSNTTEIGRPQIERYAGQLILVLNVNDLGHVTLFFKPKTRTHMVTFLRAR